jgi:hypothetical protein
MVAYKFIILSLLSPLKSPNPKLTPVLNLRLDELPFFSCELMEVYVRSTVNSTNFIGQAKSIEAQRSNSN